MTLSRDRQPGDRSQLQRWLAEWAATEGVTAGRLQRRVSVLVVSAMLDHLRDDDGHHRFVAKGGAALEELLDDDDLGDARSACVDVFAIRDAQPWPPALVAPPHWPALWKAVVEEDQFPVATLDDAVERVRTLIRRIDAATAG